MSDVAARVARLNDEQRAALLARARDAIRAPPTSSRIPSAPRDGDAVALSFTQQRLWFLEQFAPGLPLHNMSGVARIPIAMDPEVIAECLDIVVRRHEILRTAFVVRDGVPVGVVADEVEIPLQVLDELTPEERERRFLADARQPFELTSAPLLRLAVARTGRGDCLIQLTMHHLVSDGFSTGVLLGEVGALYRLRVLGRPLELPPLPFDFADFAAWQRERSEHGGDAALLAHWTEHLDGAPQQIALPADRPRPARMTYRGRRLTIELPGDVVAAVRRLSAEGAVTPFVTLLAGLLVVLTRYASQDDLIVGVPVANREQPGSEQLIGPFMNTLPLRFALSGVRRFDELLQHVKQTVLSGFEHQAAPFERVLHAAGAARDPSRSPLYQVMLNVQVDQSDAARGPSVELRELPNGSSQVDLMMNLVIDRDRIRGHVDYYADVYDERSVAAIVESLVMVLRAAGTDGARAIGELPLMSSRRVARLLAETSACEQSYDADGCAHELVLSAARRHPDRVAVVGGDAALTYGELDARSAALAAALHARLDAAPGAHVALFLPRSVDTLVATLGVLRAGLAFVPLDPELPPERIALVAADAAIAAVVTRGEHADRLPPLDAPTVLLESATETRATAPAQAVDPEACAYTMYTSGSTGRPNGVRIAHRSLVNLLASMRVRPGVDASDVLLAVTSPSFDISLLELLLPLTAGARVVVVPPSAVADGTRLATLLERHAVTVMQATPATWQLLLDAGWRGRRGLRALCGGEAFPPALAEALLGRCAEVWNVYGPTETTIWSTIHRLQSADVAAGGIPIGRPIGRTTAFVLDERLAPVPPGVLGELCLGGAGLALDYHARPLLTAARFVEAPFRKGHRIYRTGDLVRMRADGTLLFGGRRDDQVKLHGFRIELGEVEAALEAHPDVARAVATLHGQGPRRALACFVQAASGGGDDAPRPETLREHLLERLPAHMVPARIVVVSELPLTPTGKVDRGALPALDAPANDPAGGTVRAARRRVAPRNDTERQLAAIWSELLELPSVGVDDGFFEFGGTSLLATTLVFRIREALGIDLPLHVLFDGEPTIARLATTIETGEPPRQQAGSSERLDLAAEAQLPDEILPRPGEHVHSVRHPQNLLVTGATGFVGAHLLAELLTRTAASALCLVRASSRAEGHARIRAALEQHEMWDDAFAARIVPIVGSLSRPRLGLRAPEWQHLAATVDGIFHVGAEVSFLQPYELLKPANVLGTQELLRLACSGAVKPLHYVSTTYVFARFSYPPHAELTEEMDPLHDLDHTFGYTQSKWVGERLVLEAGRRGLPVYVYRAGRVAGHSRTGACQTYDFVWQATKVGIELGVAPLIDMQVDITPVDFVVAALVHLSRQPELQGRVFHLVAQEPIDERALVDWMEAYGYRGEQTSFGDWCERVLRHAVELSDATAGALAPFLSGILPLERIPPARFDRTNVDRGLAGSGIVCPPIDDRLLRTYFNWFTANGHLPPPADKLVAVDAKEAR